MRNLHPTPYRTHISTHDFETASAFIEAANKYLESDIEYESLLESAIIRYARPFSCNERGNSQADSRIDVNIKQILDSQPEIELHNRLITLRNKVVAHAESSFFPTKLLDPVGNSRASGYAVTSNRWHIIQEKIDLHTFARIAKKMRSACINQMLDWMDKPEAGDPSRGG
jgi:hypothetical protein